MSESTITKKAHNPLTLDEMKARARKYRESKNHFSDNIFDVENELRNRRKAFLGSSVPLTDIVYNNGKLEKEAVNILVDYLSERTAFYWDKSIDCAKIFCHRFYELAIVGIADVFMQDQCVDDIIRLATLITHDPIDIFEYVMKDLLPVEYLPLLLSFTEDYDSSLSAINTLSTHMDTCRKTLLTTPETGGREMSRFGSIG